MKLERKNQPSPLPLTLSELVSRSTSPELVRRFILGNPFASRPRSPDQMLHRSLLVLRSQDGLIQSHLQAPEVDLPMIRRTGAAPPSMLVPALAASGDLYTTDPDEQRLGCGHISLQTATKHLGRLFRRAVALMANADPKIAGFARCEFLKRLKEQASRTQAKGAFARFRLRLDAIFSRNLPEPNLVKRIKHDPEFVNALAELIWAAKRRKQDFKHMACADLATGLRDEIQNWSSGPDAQTFAPDQSLDERTIQRTLITFVQAVEAMIHLLEHLKRLSAGHRSAIQIAIQGAGDIAMNYGKLACQATANGHVRIIKADGEPIDQREYTSLLSFKPGKDTDRLVDNLRADGLQTAGRLAIGRIRFNQYSDSRYKIKFIGDDKDHLVGDRVDYVLTGSRLARQGRVVEAHEVAELFSDRRHLLNMPNLNPDTLWLGAEKAGRLRRQARLAFKLQGLPSAVKRLKSPNFDPPVRAAKSGVERVWRTLFGVPQAHDIWLGEAVFLKNPDLFKAACEHAVEMELAALGAPIDWITICLLAWEYEPRRSRDGVAKRGDFTWDFLDPSNPKLVWFPKAAHYPCTLVGIGSLRQSASAPGAGSGGANPPGDLFLLAWGHSFDQNRGYTIFEAAEVLCSLGACDVLVIDEGRDVFQYFFSDWTSMKANAPGRLHAEEHFGVPPCRGRESIRGTVCFWIDP